MVIYKSEFTDIHYFESEQLIETVWHGFAPSEHYRTALQKYIEVIREYDDITRWLGDYRLARVVRPVDQEWTTKEWASQFMPLTSRIQKMAKVNSLDVSSQISSDNMKQELDLSRLPFLFKDFDDYAQARAWVLS